ncbi:MULTISPECIES: helix-turn-helix domain-containing protein [Acidobacterium]
MMLTLVARQEGNIRQRVAGRFKARRLAMNLPQQELARRSGVPLSTLKRFEREGLISLDALLSLATVLDCLEDFERLAASPMPTGAAVSLDALLKARKPRQRATGKREGRHAV